MQKIYQPNSMERVLIWDLWTDKDWMICILVRLIGIDLLVLNAH